MINSLSKKIQSESTFMSPAHKNFAKPVELATSYTAVAKLLHWSIGFLIIGMLISGLLMEDLTPITLKFQVIQLHKSFGITILILATLRVLWRLTHKAPPLPFHMPHWQKGAAHLTHFGLYVLMFAMPITGYLMSDASGYHPNLFGLQVPVLMNAEPSAAKNFFFLHENGAALLWALLAAHVAGALFHHFIVKDNTLRRMLPNCIKVSILAALTMLPFAARATDWTINPAASTLNFKASFNGQPVMGAFPSWTGAITFDEAHLETSKIAISVDLASVATQDTNRDTTLKGSDFFNVPAHPKAEFQSTKILKTGDSYTATGFLTLAGVTKPLAVPFMFAPSIDGRKATATGKFNLSRTLFGVGKGDWAKATEIADAVEVTFTVSADATRSASPTNAK
jgi:cytochrome b561